jgi:hypothetical protein
LPTTKAGAKYTATLAASGGTPAYTWSHAAFQWLFGLSLNPATGAIGGTVPNVNPGNYTLAVTVTDSLGQQTSKSFTLVVQ